jgi:hypothetical protein
MISVQFLPVWNEELHKKIVIENPNKNNDKKCFRAAPGLPHSYRFTNKISKIDFFSVLVNLDVEFK